LSGITKSWGECLFELLGIGSDLFGGFGKNGRNVGSSLAVSTGHKRVVESTDQQAPEVDVGVDKLGNGRWCFTSWLGDDVLGPRRVTSRQAVDSSEEANVSTLSADCQHEEETADGLVRDLALISTCFRVLLADGRPQGSDLFGMLAGTSADATGLLDSVGQD